MARTLTTMTNNNPFGAIERLFRQAPTPTLGARASREMHHNHEQAVVRSDKVLGDASVGAVKMHAIDCLARGAMSGQMALNRYMTALAQGDPFAAEDLKFFSDVAKVGKGEVIAGAIFDMANENKFGRR